MPCYGPLFGYYCKEANADGSRSLTFDKRKSLSGVPITIPCGECIGCRMSWRRQWAIRCMHEKRLHAASAFVTLTYADEFLPSPPSLSFRHLQLFMKRLRLRRPVGLRFFACGEYGDSSARPHYHLLLLNTDFADQRFYKFSQSSESLYRSVELSLLWPSGDAYIGSVTAQSAAYVCGYVTKKVGKPELLVPGFEPEFRVMSRRPGLGLGWFDKFKVEAYKHDSVVLRSSEVAVPRYYDTKLELEQPGRLRLLKRERKRKALFINPQDRTKSRMRAREVVALASARRFERDV